MEAPAIQIFKALSDETRLRILGVLHREPLSVNELLEVLEMGQSRVSRHLKILSDAGILEGRREGSRVYYRINAGLVRSRFLSGIMDLVLPDRGDPHRSEKIESLLPREMERDARRLGQVVEARKNFSLNHFQKHGLDQERLQEGLVDARYYRERIVSLLPSQPGTIVDLGCGTGELSRLLSSHAERLILVDQSETMLDRARSSLPEDHLEFRLGWLEHLPSRDREADLIVASMVLHHMPDPLEALQEMRRVLKPGGMLLVAELSHHEEEVMRSRFADFWLGFEREQLRDYLEKAGFQVETLLSGRGEGRLELLFLVAHALDFREEEGEEREEKERGS